MTHAIEEKLRELKGVLGSKADKLRLAYCFETDPDSKRAIESQIDVLYAQHFRLAEIDMAPPPSTVSYGDYPLGTVTFNGKAFGPFGLRERELSQHVLIAGRSDSGKSNTMLVLAKHLIEKRKPFLLFSFKREYRGLLSYSPTTLLLTGGRSTAPLRFNPLLVPHGTDRDTWINLLAEAMATTYFAGEGVMSLLRKGLSYVYDHFPNPKPMHLKVWLEDLQRGQRRESDWLASARRVVDAMCFGPLGDVLNSDNPIPLEQLLDKQVVLELDNFNDDDRTFIVQCIMRWVYRHALENFPRNECRYVLLIDEAHHIFLKRHSDLQGKETYSDAILRMVRECSVGFVLADQHPSLISLPALGNTFTTVAMNLKTRADCLAIGNAMLLTEEQRDYLGRLPVGSAIVKLQDRYVEPFMIQVPRAGDLPAVSDSEIAERMASAFPQPLTTSAVSVDGTREIRRDAEFPVQEERAPPAAAERAEPPDSVELHELEKAFLASVLEHPFMGTSSRYGLLQVSTRHGTEAKDRLVQAGYIVPVPIHVHQNTMTLFELTEKAKTWLRDSGYRIREERSEGGIEHRFGVWYASRYFRERGFVTELEKRTPQGKFIDLVASKNDAVIANEIETGKSDVLANVVNAFEAGYFHVQVIATSQDALQKCRRAISSFTPKEGQHLEINYLLPHVQHDDAF